MTNKTKTRLFYSGALVFLVLFFASARYVRHLLITNHRFSSGKVYEVRRTGRSHIVRLAYTFEATGRTYDVSTIYEEELLPIEDAGMLLGKTFPVIYYTKMPALANQLLLFPPDYEQYQISYPDSLKWLLPFVKL